MNLVNQTYLVFGANNVATATCNLQLGSDGYLKTLVLTFIPIVSNTKSTAAFPVLVANWFKKSFKEPPGNPSVPFILQNGIGTKSPSAIDIV